MEQKTLVPLGASIGDLAGQLAAAVNTTLAAGFGITGAARGLTEAGLIADLGPVRLTPS